MVQHNRDSRVDFKHNKTMSDKLTESVARLYRAGSENSMQTQKLCEAVDRLLTWIKENVEAEDLPCDCIIYSSGEFMRVVSGQLILYVTIGKQHSVKELHRFAELIAEGFLDKLCKQMESRAKTFSGSVEKIEQFLERGHVGFLQAHREFINVRSKGPGNWAC